MSRGHIATPLSTLPPHAEVEKYIKINLVSHFSKQHAVIADKKHD
jgi:hypothetical protein